MKTQKEKIREIIEVISLFKNCPNYPCKKGVCLYGKTDIFSIDDRRILYVAKFMEYHKLNCDDLTNLLLSYRKLKPYLYVDNDVKEIAEASIFDIIKYIYDLFSLNNTWITWHISNICPKEVKK